jgi:hypothetical protein
MIHPPTVKASTGNMLPNSWRAGAAVGRVLDQKALSAGAVLVKMFWTGCRIGLDISCWYCWRQSPEQVIESGQRFHSVTKLFSNGGERVCQFRIESVTVLKVKGSGCE